MQFFINGLLFSAFVVADYTAMDWIRGRPFLAWAGSPIKRWTGIIFGLGWPIVMYNFFPAMLLY